MLDLFQGIMNFEPLPVHETHVEYGCVGLKDVRFMQYALDLLAHWFDVKVNAVLDSLDRLQSLKLPDSEEVQENRQLADDVRPHVLRYLPTIQNQESGPDMIATVAGANATSRDQ